MTESMIDKLQKMLEAAIAEHKRLKEEHRLDSERRLAELEQLREKINAEAKKENAALRKKLVDRHGGHFEGDFYIGKDGSREYWGY